MKGAKLILDEMLIDTHAHLDQVEELERAIENARAVGVKRIIAVGMDVESNLKTLELARRFSETVYPAIGYHPWAIREGETEETFTFLENHLDVCIAMGEVGLDYKVKVKKPIQQDVFFRILQLAEKRKKPVIIHSRFSHERCYRMVAASGVEKAVFHWYTGPPEILDRVIQDGYWVSATPALAYSPPHQAAIVRAPLERILVETDTPVSYQGKVSEPAHLLTTLAELGRLKKMPVEELSSITSVNARRFFGI